MSGQPKTQLIDWDDAFDNSGYVPEAEALLARWVTDAAEFRERLFASGQADLDQVYGPHPRQAFDFFRPKADAKGTVVFVHGGYWHMRGKSDWSHLFEDILRKGWSVAVVGYPLAPDVSISEITKSVGAAVSEVAKRDETPIRLVGHSAGGHLVTRMLGVGVLDGKLIDRIKRVVAVSGVFDLRPLLSTKMNEILNLTEHEADAESPLLHSICDVPATFWVGTEERPEFLRQNRLAAERFAGPKTSSVYAEGRNHFTVLQDFIESPNLLVQEVLR